MATRSVLSDSEKKRQKKLLEMLQELDRKKKPTNGDLIRSMTDEQLAEFIANDCLEISDKICGKCPQTDNSECGAKACTDYIKKWLQSESEG